MKKVREVVGSVWIDVKVVRASAEFIEPRGGAVVTSCVSGSMGV